MNERETAVYEGVYDVLEENMELRGETAPVSKSVFMLSIGHKANIVDLEKFKELDNEDFINAAYLELLRRFPFPGDVEYWMRISDYKRKLILSIMNTPEFWNLHIQVDNNPYPISKARQKYRDFVYGGSREEFCKKWYYRLYMRFPEKIRKGIKKVVRL